MDHLQRANLSGTVFWMAKKKKKPIRTPEERARSEEVGRKLAERIAYHEAKLAEERAARGSTA